MDQSAVTVPAMIAAACWLVLARARPENLFLLRAPGILTHELAHWVTAKLTRSDPSPIRVPWRRGKDGSVSYAHVEFVPGFLTAGLVAMAPLIVTPWAAMALLQGGVLSAIAAGSILAHGYPSGADWRILLSRPASWPFSVIAVSVAYIEWWNTWIAL